VSKFIFVNVANVNHNFFDTFRHPRKIRNHLDQSHVIDMWPDRENAVIYNLGFQWTSMMITDVEKPFHRDVAPYSRGKLQTYSILCREVTDDPDLAFV
jgi:hypothetical protein